MKIVLVHPAVTRLNEMVGYSYARTIARKSRRRRIMPTGLLSLYCNSEHQTHFIDNRIDNLSNEALATRCMELIGKGEGIVGFGGTCMEQPQAAAVARMLNRRITTVYGGPNATARPEKHVRDFDFVVSGHGLGAFRRLADGDDLSDIAGISSGDDIVGPAFPTNISRYRWPTEADVPERYRGHYDFNAIISSIGCPFACRFCSSQTIWQRYTFFRDAEEVLAEVAGKPFVEFRDDNFTFDKQRLEYFCTELKRMGIRWACQSRVTSLDEDTIVMMRQSGCRKVSCGFESYNDVTLEAIGKGHTVKQIDQVRADCQRHRLKIVGGWVVGFPHEGEDEIKQTVAVARGKIVPLLGFPVSAIYRQIIDEGLVEHDWCDGEVLFPRTRTLSRKRVEELARGLP